MRDVKNFVNVLSQSSNSVVTARASNLELEGLFLSLGLRLAVKSGNSAITVSAKTFKFHGGARTQNNTESTTN